MNLQGILAKTTSLTLGLLLLPLVSLAQDEEEPELGWTNETDFSLVVTDGTR